jgi:hypothetical protein
MKKSLLIVSMSVLVSSAFALTASDDASNYGGGWSTGDNSGSGFGTWDLTDNNNNGTDVFAGYLIGNSTEGAGDLNTGTNQSFYIYANPVAAFASAQRDFNTALVLNDQFTFNFGVQNDNGNKGFTIRNDGDQEVFGFNVGSGASVNGVFTNNPVAATYDFGGGDALLQAVITIIDDSVGSSQLSYSISRISSAGTQGVLFSGTIIGITGLIDNFTFYNSGTDAGENAANNLYFNSLSVASVPEPGAYALIAGALALLCVATRRRG